MNYTGSRATDTVSQMEKQDDRKHAFFAMVMTILPFLQQRKILLISSLPKPHLNQTTDVSIPAVQITGAGFQQDLLENL